MTKRSELGNNGGAGASDENGRGEDKKWRVSSQ